MNGNDGYDHNRQKKAAVINDFTSFGRCSLAVTMPILSALKVQCCPVPTAIFTNHTGFPSYAWTDYTAHMDDYIAEWKKLNLRFDAIQTGFLGSKAQVDFVYRFLKEFRTKDTIVCVDPVMGDYGKLYATYNQELAEAMRGFLDVADILTPNLTEACVLLDIPYREDYSDAELADLCRELCSRHASKVVISGIPHGDFLIDYIYVKGRMPTMSVQEKIGGDRSGTGDVFSSVLLADAINGMDFEDSVEHAGEFIEKAIRRAIKMGIPEKDGLPIEEVLQELV